MSQGVVGASNTTSHTQHPEEIDQAFQEFISKYGTRYSTSEEYDWAKDAFAENLREIASLRASGDLTHEVGLNEFADVPPWYYHGRVCLTVKRRVQAAPPSSIDWEAAGALAP
ncbi:hypothetical protein FOZ63_014043, partial [Perkinsus olseni]